MLKSILLGSVAAAIVGLVGFGALAWRPASTLVSRPHQECFLWT
jgi:hypothetical protein